jgi:hypothetical protein
MKRNKRKQRRENTKKRKTHDAHSFINVEEIMNDEHRMLYFENDHPKYISKPFTKKDKV